MLEVKMWNIKKKKKKKINFILAGFIPDRVSFLSPQYAINLLLAHWSEHDANSAKITGSIPVQAIHLRELDLVILGCPFQLRIFCGVTP